MNTKKFFLPWLVFELMVFATITYGQKVGTTSLQFLKVMPVARATGMGEAVVASCTGIDAIYWNPAGMTSIEHHEFTSTYTQWLFDTKLYALGYGLTLGDFGTLGIQYQIVDYGSIKETSVEQLGYLDYQGNNNPGSWYSGFTGRTFTPYAWLLGVGYAKQMTDHFSIGVSVKYVTESLWNGGTITTYDVRGNLRTFETVSHSFLFDVGMLYNTGFHTVRIGATVQNFGSSIKYAEEAFPPPLTFRLGLAADIIGSDALIGESSTNRLTTEIDLIQPNDYDQHIHAGVEMLLYNMITLRAGYKWNYDADGFTFGGGILLATGSITTRLDYSFGSMGENLTNVHRLSLGVNFK